MTKHEKMRLITMSSKSYTVKERCCPSCKKLHSDNKSYVGVTELMDEFGDWCLSCVLLESLLPGAKDD